jgi:hypothetical protein
MRRSIASCFFPVAAVVLATVAGPSRAAFDLVGALAGLDGANVATVVLVPPMAVFKDALNSAGLQNAGCHYTTADPTAIRVLVAILKTADATVNPVYQRPDMREGVYFAMNDGTKFSILFADHSSGRLPVLGVAEAVNGGQIQSTSVLAKASLSTDVRTWARHYGGAGTGTACNLQSPTAEDPQAPPPAPR